MAVLRMVVQKGFTKDLASCLLGDIRQQVKLLEASSRPPIPLVDEKAREAFRH